MPGRPFLQGRKRNKEEKRNNDGGVLTSRTPVRNSYAFSAYQNKDWRWEPGGRGFFSKMKKKAEEVASRTVEWAARLLAEKNEVVSTGERKCGGGASPSDFHKGFLHGKLSLHLIGQLGENV